MEHDNNPSRTAANAVIRSAMADRQEQLNIVNDARYEIQKIEHGVKEHLIKQRRMECLKIDWAKVKTALNY